MVFCLQAKAVEVRVTGPNNTALFSQNTNVAFPVNVGEATLEAFERFEIPFEGGTYGFSKIFEFGNELKTISKSEMKAYGWCFSVDGVTPETMADETPIRGTEKLIEWYYAYAHFKEGLWISQCVRAAN